MARSIGLAAAAVAVGVVAWSGVVLTLPVAMAFPALWARARSRASAAGVAAAYFLGASRGVPPGAATFYGSSMAWGLALWVIASLAFVVVHALLWTAEAGPQRTARYAAAAFLMSVPPLGIVGWAHPLTAAGVLFPEWGWLGLTACVIALLAMTTAARWIASAILAACWLWSAITWTSPWPPEGWAGIDLAMGARLGRDNDLDRHRALVATVAAAAGRGARVVVLPESALGLWTPTVARFWADGLETIDVTVIAGAAVVDPDGYDNVLVAIDPRAGRVLYRQRMPVPVSMWQPWLNWLGQNGSAHADFFGNPLVTVGGRQIAPLICYEQLIIWPVLQSMAQRPDVILAVGNDWWTSGTSIMAIQRESVVAWARLFGVPVVAAFNR